jgi:BirA family transcriptional regulator, biotin operon repressor / biotin---[acetyl-CoA-carboxylase] ligase
VTRLGLPRLHLRETESTNAVARELAGAGAPHGTVVTAGHQTSGRGRQGRAWVTQPGGALLASLVLRRPDPLLSLRGGLAVADLAGPDARVKWPNDVLVDGRKIAGILAEGRPQEGWAVLGIGINLALDPSALPPEARERAGTLGRRPDEVEAVLGELLEALGQRLGEPPAATLAALREQDALRGAPVRWAGGTGTGAGVDDGGRLLVRDGDGQMHALDAGEVHLLA